MTIPTGAATRALNIKLISFAREAWAEAQQKESKFKMLGTKSVDMEGSDFKLFVRSKKVKYSKKAAGVVATPNDEQTFKARRAIITESYHHAIQADVDDLTNNQADVFAVHRPELVKAQGRLCDETILKALVYPCLLYTSPSPRDRQKSRMPSSA